MANDTIPFTIDVGASLMCDMKGHASTDQGHGFKQLPQGQAFIKAGRWWPMTTNGDDNDAYDENNNDGGDDGNKRR